MGDIRAHVHAAKLNIDSLRTRSGLDFNLDW